MAGRAAVLIIEADEVVRDATARALSAAGFDVECADSGRAALDAVHWRRFDVALADLHLPDLGGVAIVEQLRAFDAELEVIVGSAHAAPETVVACFRRGAADVVRKPYDTALLKELFERAMRRNHLEAVVASYEASRALLGTLDRDELVGMVLRVAKDTLHADGIGLLLWSEAMNRYSLEGSGNTDADEDIVLQQIGEQAIADGATARVPLVEGEPLPEAWASTRVTSLLAYPLVVNGRKLGALALLRRSPSPAFLASELHRGTAFSSQLSLSLENARLYEALESKATELVQTRDQLLRVEKLALAGNFAGAIAHEINNPLSFVRANLDALRAYASTINALWGAAKAAGQLLAQAGAPGADDATAALHVGGSEEETDQLVEDIGAIVEETLVGVRRIGDLVSSFRSLAEATERTPAEQVGVASLLAECTALLPQQDACKPRALTVDVAESCTTFASRADLRAAVLHLLRELCGREGVDTGVVVTAAVGAQGGWELDVRDRSLRLSAAERSKLFEPRVEVGDGGGSGGGRRMKLNLHFALAHQLLSRNGAHISVDDDGEGTRFRVSLPPALAMSADAPILTPASSSSAASPPLLAPARALLTPAGR